MKAKGLSGSRRFSARLKWTRPTRFHAGLHWARKLRKSVPAAEKVSAKAASNAATGREIFRPEIFGRLTSRAPSRRARQVPPASAARSRPSRLRQPAGPIRRAGGAPSRSAWRNRATRRKPAAEPCRLQRRRGARVPRRFPFQRLRADAPQSGVEVRRVAAILEDRARHAGYATSRQRGPDLSPAHWLECWRS